MPAKSNRDEDRTRTRAQTVKEVLEPLRPVYDAWMVVVRAFSWVVARIAVGLLFVIGFIPYGLVMRLVGVDPLTRDLTEDRDTYWTDPTDDNHDLDEFRKQY